MGDVTEGLPILYMQSVFYTGQVKPQTFPSTHIKRVGPDKM